MRGKKKRDRQKNRKKKWLVQDMALKSNNFIKNQCKIRETIYSD